MHPTPQDVVRSWFERVWNQGDEAAIDELFAQNGIAHGLPSPDGQSLAGPTAFKPFFHRFRSAFPDIRVRIEHCVTEDDFCVAHCLVTGTHTGDTLGMPATGHSVSFSGMSLSRVEGGMIQEAWNSFDFLSLYQQLGLVSLPTS